MQVRGFTKVRNEAHIVKDTLDNWAQYCDGGIHVYDDNSEDETAEICREHPAVVEVITSTLIDPNRERAEYYNRQVLLTSIRRFVTQDDWIVYFDGDEWLYDFDAKMLKDPEVEMIACRSHDAYITPEDATSGWRLRRPWVSREFEFAPYFYRVRPWQVFNVPDQRNLKISSVDAVRLQGNVLHWGKGISEEHWERKCDYYANVFGPKYSKKWKARKGNAVHKDMKSDFGFDLVPWQDVRDGKVDVFNRAGCPIVK